MTEFLTGLADRLAEKWLTLLVLPGLLLAGTAGLAAALGQRHWASWGRVPGAVDSVSADLQAAGGVGTALAAAGVLLAAAAAGLLARGVTRLVQLAVLGSRPAAAVARRRARWDRADAAFERAALAADDGAHPTGDGDGNELARLAAARDRVAPAPPVRATWTGDRLAGTGARVRAAYGLDLGAVWPRLWLVLPAEAREPLVAARAGWDSATGLVGWGVLYLAVGARWWPAAVAGAVTCLTGWRRTRSAAAALADLVEATVDVHGADLAARLVPGATALTPEVGRKLTLRCRKGG